jgi:hypothetical protein
VVCPHCQAAVPESHENCFRSGKGHFSMTERAILDDRYQVIKSLGRGGMGMVILVVDFALDGMPK